MNEMATAHTSGHRAPPPPPREPRRGVQGHWNPPPGGFPTEGRVATSPPGFLASASIQDTDLDAATGSGAADPCRNVPDPSSPELPPDSTWGADERCPSDGLVASSGRTIPTTSTLPRLVSMRGAVLADNAVSRPGTDAPCEAASYPFRGDAPGFRRASLAASDTFSGAVLENIRIPGIGGSTLARGTFTLRGELMHA